MRRRLLRCGISVRDGVGSNPDLSASSRTAPSASCGHDAALALVSNVQTQGGPGGNFIGLFGWTRQAVLTANPSDISDRDPSIRLLAASDRFL